MSETSTAHATPRARLWWRALAFMCVIAAAFGGSAAATWGYLREAAKLPAVSTSTTVLRGTSSVVAAIRDLAVLETASYHMERVIDLRDKQTQFYGLFESEDALLLVAAADVVAGVDLSLLRDGDVRFDPDKHVAYITLPPPIVLSARLDNDSTYVHTRKTDALALRAKTLETRARQEAEHALREAALDAGILRRARDNAERTVRTLVQSLGFDRV
ncbi:MAG TPA: DUF4230 domain-containing protein, partial [Polyangiales bacterium]